MITFLHLSKVILKLTHIRCYSRNDGDYLLIKVDQAFVVAIIQAVVAVAGLSGAHAHWTRYCCFYCVCEGVNEHVRRTFSVLFTKAARFACK